MRERTFIQIVSILLALAVLAVAAWFGDEAAREFWEYLR
jgi:hypothetical protein